MVRLTGPMEQLYSGPMTEAGPGADFLQLSPAAAPARGLAGWRADAIRAAIIDGRLGTGTSLPATRLLADDLGVSRGVVVEAYQRLADEGLVNARAGGGAQGTGLLPRIAGRPGTGEAGAGEAGAGEAGLGGPGLGE